MRVVLDSYVALSRKLVVCERMGRNARFAVIGHGDLVAPIVVENNSADFLGGLCFAGLVAVVIKNVLGKSRRSGTGNADRRAACRNSAERDSLTLRLPVAERRLHKFVVLRGSGQFKYDR